MLYLLLPRCPRLSQVYPVSMSARPQSEPSVSRADNPSDLSEGHPLHILTAIQKQDFLTLSCVYCAQDMFPNALRITLMGNIQLLRKPVTPKPPFLSAFLQGHNKAGYH